MKILGAKLEASDLEVLRRNRVINFEGMDALNVVVDFLQKPNGDTTQENLINRLEKLISRSVWWRIFLMKISEPPRVLL